MTILTSLLQKSHYFFLVCKYLLLGLTSLIVTTVISGWFYILIGVVLFGLFDLCSAELWIIFRKQKKETSLLQISSFYVVQIISIVLFIIAIFKPSWIAEPLAVLVDKFF